MKEIDRIEAARKSVETIEKLSDGKKVTESEMLEAARNYLISDTLPFEAFYHYTGNKKFIQICSIFAALTAAWDDEWIDEFHDASNRLMAERYEVAAAVLKSSQNKTANTKTAYLYKKSKKGFGR